MTLASDTLRLSERTVGAVVPAIRRTAAWSRGESVNSISMNRSAWLREQKDGGSNIVALKREKDDRFPEDESTDYWRIMDVYDENSTDL